jgi:peptidoglycan DL-endopeptidase CwlO
MVRRPFACFLATFAIALLAATASLALPSDIRDKKAEAERLYAQIQQIDTTLEQAVEAYNGASYELSQLEEEIRVNQRHLDVARSSYRVAQRNLAKRIVALYQNGEDDLMEVILGATNLDDLLDRLDSAKRISSQDVQIIEAVTRTKHEIRARERTLERARVKQKQVVAERASEKESVESQLAARQDLYNSIKDQIADLEAQERERQRRLAEEAERAQEQARALAEAAGVVIPDTISTPQGIGTAPPSQLGAQAVAIALQYLGRPYVWGASGPDYFDCSGLISFVYAQLGVSLPHHASSQFAYGVPVSFGELAPGDLVFFHGLSHVGMYIGNGAFVHAPHTGDVVKISSIYESWYQYGFEGGRRIG